MMNRPGSASRCPIVHLVDPTVPASANVVNSPSGSIEPADACIGRGSVNEASSFPHQDVRRRRLVCRLRLPSPQRRTSREFTKQMSIAPQPPLVGESIYLAPLGRQYLYVRGGSLGAAPPNSGEQARPAEAGTVGSSESWSVWLFG